MACGADTQQELIDVVGTGSAHDGAPLAGVSVTPLLFPNNRAATDADGQYQVRTSSNDILLFTFVGYQQVKVAVDGRQRSDVVMEGAETFMDEVVVVAYGEQKKISLTGAISSVADRKSTRLNSSH